MKVYIATDSNGKCGVFYSLKESEEYLKQSNLGKMPKYIECINGLLVYVGINSEDSYIQSYNLKKCRKTSLDGKEEQDG